MSVSEVAAASLGAPPPPPPPLMDGRFPADTMSVEGAAAAAAARPQVGAVAAVRPSSSSASFASVVSPLMKPSMAAHGSLGPQRGLDNSSRGREEERRAARREMRASAYPAQCPDHDVLEDEGQSHLRAESPEENAADAGGVAQHDGGRGGQQPPARRRREELRKEQEAVARHLGNSRGRGGAGQDYEDDEGSGSDEEGMAGFMAAATKVDAPAGSNKRGVCKKASWISQAVADER